MRNYKSILVAAVLSLLVLPLWIVHFPPLVDYPNHLSRAFILAHAHSPNFSKFYVSEWGPYPYLLMDVLLVPAQVFLPIPLAGRILLTLAVIAVPLSCWFFLRAANPGSETMSVFSLLICYNPLFRSGFINWTISIAICFFFVGLWLRYNNNFGILQYGLLFFMATALYFSHVLNFAVAGFITLTYSLSSRYPLRRIATSMLPFIPGVLLYLYWKSKLEGGIVFHFNYSLHKFLNLMEPIRTLSNGLDLIVILSVFACIVYLVAWNRELKWNRSWLFTFGAFLTLYIVSPDIVGTFLDVRLTFVVLFLFFSTFSPGKRLKHIIPVILILFLMQVAYIGHTFQLPQEELESMEKSFSSIPMGSRILPIVQSHGEPLSGRYYAHFWAYGVIERELYSPYIFHNKGINPQPLKFCISTYAPRGFGWLDYTEEPDWGRVASDYEYVWAYNIPRFESALNRIGTKVFSNEKLNVYRLNR